MSDLDIPTADPDAVRREADRILDLPEFRDDRSLLERGLDWLAEQLSRLIPDGAGGGGGAGGVVVLLLVGLGLVVLALGGRALLRLWRERAAAGARRPGLTVVLGEAVDPGELELAIAQAEATGDWRAALLARYRLMVATLVGEGALADHVGRTTGEYREEMAQTRPDRSAEFSSATDAFEHAFYGAAKVEADDVSRLRDQSAAVLGASADRT